MNGLYGFTTPLWPIRYKPLPDELLSSWIVRLAHGHGLKVQTFCNRLFGNRKQIWNRDIDRLAPDWLLAALALHTGTAESRVFDTTLRRYEGLLYRRFRSTGHLHWIQLMQMYHRKRTGFGQQYCSMCLAEDVVPYFRTRWRLSLLTICTVHQCLLTDRCTACDAPVSFHRTDTGLLLDDARGLSSCFQCGTDLSKAGPAEIPGVGSEPVQWLMAIARHVEAFSVGAADLDHEGTLAVLHHLIYLMCSSSKSILLNEHVADCMDMPTLEFAQGKRSFIEACPILDRHQLLMQAAWMMLDLAPRIREAWRCKAIRYNHFRKDFSDAPDWYRQIVAGIPHNVRGGLYPEWLRKDC